MNKRTTFPIRWMLVFPTLAICAAAGYYGYAFLSRAWTAETERLLVTFSMKRLRSVSEQMETRIRSRYQEITTVCQRVYKTYRLKQPINAAEILDSVSPELSRDLIGLSFYTGDPEGKITHFSFVNFATLEESELPRDLVDEIERKYPINVRALMRKKGTELFNRSVLDENGEPIPVMTFAISGRGMDALQNPTLILADFKAGSISLQENAAQLGEVYWMKRDGTILAHPSAAMSYRYSLKPMEYDTASLMDRATEQGEHLVLQRDGHEYLTTVVPTALENVFGVAEVPTENSQASLKNLAFGIGVAFLGLVTALVFFLTYIAARITAKIARIERVVREVAQGFAPTRRLFFVDEFSWIASAVSELTRSRMQPTTEPGLNQSQASQNTDSAPLKFSDVLRVDTAELAFFQPQGNPNPLFWDVSKMGSRLWLFLGCPGGSSQNFPSLMQTAKQTLGTIRASKTSAQSISLSGQITQLNHAIHQGYGGTCWLNLAAAELDLSSGRLTVMNASGEAPLFSPGRLTANAEGTQDRDSAQVDPKGITDSNVAVGSRAEASFKTWETQLGPKDAFCLFQKSQDENDDGIVSFRPELRRLILQIGNTSAGDLRSRLLNSPARKAFERSLTLAVVQFLGTEARKLQTTATATAPQTTTSKDQEQTPADKPTSTDEQNQAA